MSTMFITITGLNHYLGMKPFRVGQVVRLCKEPHNEHDCEAIRVELPYIDTIGYVANSANTVYGGTYSAGRLYDKIGDAALAEVAFITHSSVIAAVIPPEAVKEMREKDPALVPELPDIDEDGASEGETEEIRFKIGF